MLQYYESVYVVGNVSATSYSLYHSHWNYTDVLTIVWRYAYAFYRILKLLFFFYFFHIFMPHHQKSGGVLCYTLWNFECTSIRPSAPPPFVCPQLLLQF